MSSSSFVITSIIQPKFTLAKLSKEEEILSIIVSLVSKIASLVDDPKFLDLLSYIANLIENFVKKKDDIDKKQLLIKIYKKVYPNISDADLQTILDNLQHLYDTGQVKKISLRKYLYHYARNFLQKKVDSMESNS
jgi:hypothetical protein